MTAPSSFPPEFDRNLNQLQIRIQQADALEQARRVDEAQAASMPVRSSSNPSSV
jgi:hypothetical protein